MAWHFVKVSCAVALGFGFLEQVCANIDLNARCDASSTFECGWQVGQQMQTPIKFAVKTLVAKLAPYMATAHGTAIFESMLDANRNAYPEVAREYEGMAKGAGVNSRELFIAVLDNELSVFAKRSGFPANTPKSCTDYHIMDAGNCHTWGHNEDNAPIYMDFTYMLRASIGNFSYVGFAYAPNAAGWAWGFNSHGMAQSVNALSPTNVTVGIGVNFLARDVLNAASLDEAIARACVKGLASGQHFNLGSIHEKDRQVMIETSPVGCDVRELVPPEVQQGPPTVAYHCNRYESKALRGIDRPFSQSMQSSIHRMQRLDALDAPRHCLTSVKEVLSDTQDKQYPIHRDAQYPDLAMTMNSVVFDVFNKSVSVWGPGAPASTPKAFVYDWRSLKRYAMHTGEAAPFGVVV